MICYEVNSYENDEGTIAKVSLKVYKDSDVIRKLEINIGDEFVVNPVNKRRLKHRGRKVKVTNFVRKEKDPLKAQVKFLDTKRVGRVDLEDLDVLS